MQETKREQKQIRQQYKDSLENQHAYRELAEELKVMKEKKAAIEAEAKAEMGSQYEKLQSLAKDISLDKELMADVAISSLMKGDTVILKDKSGSEYEPIFSVRFKKANEVSQK
jgi:cell division FtsZ-interacting protein ZapD